jgi:hypothetical protein
MQQSRHGILLIGGRTEHPLAHSFAKERHCAMNEEISGFYDDAGNKIDPELVAKPGLCILCKVDDAGGKEEILCLLNRTDQKGHMTFECDAYVPKHNC